MSRGRDRDRDDDYNEYGRDDDDRQSAEQTSTDTTSDSDQTGSFLSKNSMWIVIALLIGGALVFGGKINIPPLPGTDSSSTSTSASNSGSTTVVDDYVKKCQDAGGYVPWNSTITRKCLNRTTFKEITIE